MKRFVALLIIVFVSNCFCTVTEGTSEKGLDLGNVYFDEVPGKTDAEKLLNLPAIVQKKIQTIGVKYSLQGGWPQPFKLNTVVKVVFSNRLHDFRAVKEPVDMGHCFAFVGEGRPIFECGVDGFIRFSQRKTLIEDIAFVGPRRNIPPIIIYSKGESKEWNPSGGKAAKGVPSALGTEMDGGEVKILGCYFKGFGIAIRTQPGQHTNSARLRIADSFFYNCIQLSDNLLVDSVVIEDSWFCPTFESDKAFIVNRDALYLKNIVAVPQSDVGKLKNMRWIDNYGPYLDIRTSRFGNELVNKGDPLFGQQVSLVYNYSKFGTTWRGGDFEIGGNRNSLVIKDNCLYARNVPVVKFFEIPNNVIVTGNTGLIGNLINIKTKKEYDNSYLFEFDSSLVIPDDAGSYVTFNVSDNNRDLKISKSNPELLPKPLCFRN